MLLQGCHIVVNCVTNDEQPCDNMIFVATCMHMLLYTIYYTYLESLP